MIIEYYDMSFVKNAKPIVYISQPHGRWEVKYSDCRAFKISHICVGKDWRGAQKQLKLACK